MKKHLALVLALVMVLSSFSFVSAAPDFSDMEGHENAEAVARLELLNVLKGYPDGTFKPDNTITRAEFAAVAVRVSGLENVAMAAKGLPTGFSDVPAWHWASGYVGTAAKMGIVNGIGNGLFAPETPVKYEEAITMIVRALGYEPMAQARGGYPFGYLIVANEIDLLEDAMGTQGTWATRAFVAQITDNALEIEMMIQVGFGTDTKWVVSGEDDTEEKYLLDQMGFEVVEGVVEVQDVSDMEIEIDGDDYVAPAGFDFFMTEGAEIKAWVDGDDVIAYTINDDVYLDAVEVDGDEIDLETEDKTFDIARDAEIMLDGAAEDDDFLADFAKIVVNSDGEVSFVEAYIIDRFILVEEVDDEIILDMNDEEIDVEDFVVLKDGMTVSIDDLEMGDIVFAYEDEVLNGEYDGLAVAYNMSEMGEISRVYKDAEGKTTSFRMDGENYDLATNALYLDETGLDEIADFEDALEFMMDEESEVEIFFNFEGDVVLVVGDTGEGTTSTFYAVLTDNTVRYDGRRGDMVAFDFLNEFGEEASYDLEEADLLDDSIENNLETTTDAGIDVIVEGTLFEITVDEDGDVEEITNLELEAGFKSVTEAFEIDDTYAEMDGTDFRLMSSTVIFYDDYDEVVTLGEIDDEFSEVEEGKAFVKNGRVEVVVASLTDSDTDTTDYTGLVTKVRTLRNDDVEVTIDVAGVEMEFIAPDGEADSVKEDEIWTLEVGDTSGEIDSASKPEMVEFEVVSVDTSDKTIEVTGNTSTTYGAIDVIELTSDAMIYDESDDFEELRLRDVKAGDDIAVVFDGNSKYWVTYVIVDPAVVDNGGETPEATTYTLTAIGSVDGNTTVTLDDETYVYAGTQTQIDAVSTGDTVEVTFGELRGEVVVLTIEEVVTP